MALPTGVDEVLHEIEEPRPCSYLPRETAQLEYRVLREISAEEYERWLQRGWRRHGAYFFRPNCPACQQCIPIRVDVQNFRPTKSQRRIWRKNADVELKVRAATVTADHIELYNAWHADMTERRGWPVTTTDAQRYYWGFLLGEWGFAREFAYYRGNQLVGVGLVDVLPDSLSSVYFYHHPDWRPLGPGTFTAMKEIESARQSGRSWVYLGYWIQDCASMAYKNRFAPHQLLRDRPEFDVLANWQDEETSDT